jgi:hypothetical protein
MAAYVGAASANEQADIAANTVIILRMPKGLARRMRACCPMHCSAQYSSKCLREPHSRHPDTTMTAASRQIRSLILQVIS